MEERYALLARAGVRHISSYNQLGEEQGWPVIRWITAENNYRARALYDRLSDKTHWVTYQKPVE